MRSEDELRAAFQQKAGDAPHAADVLRAVRTHEAGPAVRRRRWLMPALAGAAAIAVGVPLGIALSQSSNPVTKKNAGAGAQHQTPLAAQGSVPSAAEGGGQASAEESGAAICRPADVTVSVQPTSLRITSRGVSCRLARTPSVQSGATMSTPARSFGTLPPDGTATAALRWTTSCRAGTGGVIRIDWGAGPVEVHPVGVPEGFCAPPSVGSFAGLR
jgi:hypothetical protein